MSTEYESILPHFPNHDWVSVSRRRNYVCGLINVALMMANVNQFKQMADSKGEQIQVVFIVAFSLTILLQLVTIAVLVLDTKLLGHSEEENYQRSAKHTTILLCLSHT